MVRLGTVAASWWLRWSARTPDRGLGQSATAKYGRPRVLARRRPSGHTEQEVTLVIAGIDTHKDTLAVAVVDEAGRLVAGGDVPNTERGFAKLVDMFNTHHVQRVGIEGSGSFGRAVAVHLALCWQSDQPVAVVEVPTLMTSRERRPGQLGKGKTDPVDALAIARITTREQQLPPVRLTVGAAADLRALARLPRGPGPRTRRPGQPGPRRTGRFATRLPAADPDPDHPRPGPCRGRPAR